MCFLEKERGVVQGWSGLKLSGRVSRVVGLVIESVGPSVHVGDICHIYGRGGEKTPCEVVGFHEQKVLLMSLGEVGSIAPGAEVYPTCSEHKVRVGKGLIGRVVDALGEPIDGKGELLVEGSYPSVAPPPKPMEREPIQEIFETKVRAIDALLTLGKGQRVGIFSPPGVGKSTLMGTLAKSSQADVNVIGLIGERGREVREFIERELGPEGLARSVVVVATADQAALLRKKGAFVTTAIAEYFRDQGLNVLLMMDSISRFAMALREIGLTIGEPPAQKGYTPSVFAELPKLVERAGNSGFGSITAIYTILSEQEEMNDPIPEQMRALLDGHLTLSKALAEKGHFPPIDILKSLSRLMPQLVSPDHWMSATACSHLIHTYEEVEQLIQIGAYKVGSSREVDRAMAKREGVLRFLQQKRGESVVFEDALKALTREVAE